MIDLKIPYREKIAVNVGSGQRRFESIKDTIVWWNLDCISRPPDQVPDVICDVGKERMSFGDGTVDYVVLHHVYEHFSLGAADDLVRECHRVLKEGGSLIVTVPNMKALAERWLKGEIKDYIFFVNTYGAYMGEPGDLHRWGYTPASLAVALFDAAKWLTVRDFNWREIPGASIARDFWIAGAECIK